MSFHILITNTRMKILLIINLETAMLVANLIQEFGNEHVFNLPHLHQKSAFLLASCFILGHSLHELNAECNWLHIQTSSQY